MISRDASHAEFSEVFNALHREIHDHHPELQKALAQTFPRTFSNGLATMAWYVDIILDGEYSTEDIWFLLHKILERLKDKRSGGHKVIDLSNSKVSPIH